MLETLTSIQIPLDTLFLSHLFTAVFDKNPILAANVNFQNVTLQRDVAVCDDKAMVKAL